MCVFSHFNIVRVHTKYTSYMKACYDYNFNEVVAPNS